MRNWGISAQIPTYFLVRNLIFLKNSQELASPIAERRQGQKVEECFLPNASGNPASLTTGNPASCEKICEFCCCQKSFEIAASHLKSSPETRLSAKSTPSSRRKRDENDDVNKQCSHSDVTGACSCVEESHHFPEGLRHRDDGQRHCDDGQRHCDDGQQYCDKEQRHCPEGPRYRDVQRHGVDGQRHVDDGQRHGVEEQRRRVPRRRRSSLVKSAHFPGTLIDQFLSFFLSLNCLSNVCLNPHSFGLKVLIDRRMLKESVFNSSVLHISVFHNRSDNAL